MEYRNKLICDTVAANDYARLPDDYFDFFFSFGVLYHQNRTDQLVVLREALAKMRPGGPALHQYADWRKLDEFKWDKGGPPACFENMPDEHIWWPRNDR